MDDSRWIAYELHDGLMQWVIGARMHMAALTAAMKEGRPTDDLQTNLTQILSFLNQATEEGRQLIRFIEGLPAGEQIDVVTTLQSTSELLTRKTVGGRPEILFLPPEEAWPTLAVDKAWPVVRIIQQAVMNAVRHSQGSRVVIQLSKSNCETSASDDQPQCQCAQHQSTACELVVMVSDDGIGFDTAQEPVGHFGLKSMRSRAREAGLDLSIESVIGRGSTIVLRVPHPQTPPPLLP